MNDFDLFLGLQLRHMLDPIVYAPPPARGLHKRSRHPVSISVLAVEPAGLELAAEAIPVVESVATLPGALMPGL
jgi:hypothetical protein